MYRKYGKIAGMTLILCVGLSACRKSEKTESPGADKGSVPSGKVGEPPSEGETGKSGKGKAGTKETSGKEVVMTEADKQRAYYFRLGNKADGGDTDAQRELGMRYLTGEGLKQSAQKGIYWLHRAAVGNNKAAQYDLAQILATAEDTEKNAPAALQWMTKAADNGLVDAQRDLAAWYMEGKLVPVDWEKAKKYLIKAAEAGDADAQYIFGEMYLSGSSVVQDEAKAREWIGKAAAQEHPRAQQRLKFLNGEVPAGEESPR